MGRVVLVTGVSHDLGRTVAASLADEPDVDRIIGVDVVPPRGDLGQVQFVRADIRNPVIAKVIAKEDVDTVVHASVLPSAGDRGGRSSTKELNVIGTMQLLAGCQRAPGLRHVVVKSSTEVYGASSRDPAMFTEDMSARRMPTSGFAKDVLEVEGYVRGFARRRPDVRVTILRTAHMIGPRLPSALGAHFRLPVVPTVLGFDARLQLLHETDVLDALRHATLRDVPGTFNIAGEGIVMLSQAVRRLGKPSVRLPVAALGSLDPVLRADLSPQAVRYLTYGRGVDTAAMRDVLGFLPDHTSASALEDFTRSLQPARTVGSGRRPEPGSVAAAGAVPTEARTGAGGGTDG